MRKNLAVLAALVSLVVLPAVAPAQPEVDDQALDRYGEARRALAASDAEAGVEALSALAEDVADSRIGDLARAAAAAPDLAAVREAFRSLSEELVRVPLRQDQVAVYCATSFDGRGAYWIQPAGTITNPYDPGAEKPCGVVVPAPYRMREVVTVQGEYLENYARGRSFSATRIEAPILDIPLSVTGITQDLSRDQQAINVNESVQNAGSVTPLVGFDDRPNYYLTRGFFALSYRDGLRTLIDGAPPINANGLELIEVLRGPSSILYGMGDPGGVVNFQSHRPLPAFGLTGDFHLASESKLRGNLDVTGPMGDVTAYRLIATLEDAESYRDDVTSRIFCVNPSLSFRFSDRASLWVTGEYVDWDYTPDSGVLVREGGTFPSTSTRSAFFGDPAVNGAETRYWRFQTEFEGQATPFWTVRAIVGAENADQRRLERTYSFIDSGPDGYLGLIPANALYRIRFDQTPERAQQNVRVENVFSFSHGAGILVRHQLLVAADYRRNREDLRTGILDHDLLDYQTLETTDVVLGFIPMGQGLFFDETSATNGEVRDAGVAAQDLIAIGDRWSILAGLRWESNRIEVSRTGARTLNAAFGGVPESLDASPPVSKTSNFAPRLGLVFKVTPTVSAFGSYLTSFISPVPGLLTEDGRTLEPERAGQWEGGVKAEVVPNRLLLTASAFQIAKRNAFVFYPTYAENAGREESTGFEAELIGSVTDHLSLMASYAHASQKFTESRPDLAGKSRAGVPSDVFSVWGVYRVSRGGFRGLGVGAGLFHRSKVWANVANTATLPGFTTLDAMLGYGRGSWRLQVNLTNLTDAEGYSPSGIFNAGVDPNIDPMTARPMPPRRVLARLTYQF